MKWRRRGGVAFASTFITLTFFYFALMLDASVKVHARLPNNNKLVTSTELPDPEDRTTTQSSDDDDDQDDDDEQYVISKVFNLNDSLLFEVEQRPRDFFVQGPDEPNISMLPAAISRSIYRTPCQVNRTATEKDCQMRILALSPCATMFEHTFCFFTDDDNDIVTMASILDCAMHYEQTGETTGGPIGTPTSATTTTTARPVPPLISTKPPKTKKPVTTKTITTTTSTTTTTTTTTGPSWAPDYPMDCAKANGSRTPHPRSRANENFCPEDKKCICQAEDEPSERCHKPSRCCRCPAPTESNTDMSTGSTGPPRPIKTTIKKHTPRTFPPANISISTPPTVGNQTIVFNTFVISMKINGAKKGAPVFRIYARPISIRCDGDDPLAERSFAYAISEQSNCVDVWDQEAVPESALINQWYQVTMDDIDNQANHTNIDDDDPPAMDTAVFVKSIRQLIFIWRTFPKRWLTTTTERVTRRAAKRQAEIETEWWPSEDDDEDDQEGPSENQARISAWTTLISGDARKRQFSSSSQPARDSPEESSTVWRRKAGVGSAFVRIDRKTVITTKRKSNKDWDIYDAQDLRDTQKRDSLRSKKKTSATGVLGQKWKSEIRTLLAKSGTNRALFISMCVLQVIAILVFIAMVVFYFLNK